MKKTTYIWLGLGTLLFVLLSAFTTGGQQSLAPLASSELAKEDGIQWLTWEEAVAKMEVEKKKILVHIYTDWCGWCKQMERTTYNNKYIVNYINSTYYPVKFNAEQEEPITMDDKTYEFVKTSNIKGSKGYHEFAKKLTMGRLTYPSTVFINEEGNILQPIAGYKDSPTFEMIVTYFGDNFYKTTPWDSYQDAYIPLKKRAKEEDKAAAIGKKNK